MKDFEQTPSAKFYGLFQYIFDHYNDEIFDGTIKDCIIVVIRQKRVMGHYIHKKWFNENDLATDELALNPSMFTKFPLIEICQTIVHEMYHGWQCHYGKPSPKGYHNKEWASKMEAIGLMPTSTGQEGGKKTGFSICDYPITNGTFIKASEILINSDVFAELYYEVNPSIINQIQAEIPLYEQIKNITIGEKQGDKPKTTRVKYSCGCCNVWGGKNLEFLCKLCGNDFLAV